MAEQRTVCVTGASGYIGSWLVKRLLERGYHVRATVRDPGNEKKVKNLLELPNANTHLSLWKADLAEEGSYDDAIQGCVGVFHVATPMELLYQDDPAANEEIESTTLNGILSILRSCSKAKTLKRFIYTSTTGTIVVQPQPPLHEYTEDLWTDVDLCYEHKMYAWALSMWSGQTMLSFRSHYDNMNSCWYNEQDQATHAYFKKAKDKVMHIFNVLYAYTYSVSETMQLKDGSKTSHTWKLIFIFLYFLYR